MTSYKLYTDGSCLRNPGVGGWAYCLIQKGEQDWIQSGSEAYTTNNRMELKAILEGLKQVTYRGKKAEVHIYTDSSYCVVLLNGGNARKNLDLVIDVRKHQSYHKIHVHKVKGHSGNEYNTIVDKLARTAAKNLAAHFDKNYKLT